VPDVSLHPGIIAICAVIRRADEFVAIANFGKARRDWLSRVLDVTNGIPSHDRFNAIFAILKPGGIATGSFVSSN
jgi:hypothetical protein